MTYVFFNEIHYENIGVDVHEGVEIAGPAGTNLDGWKLAIYDGAGNEKGELPISGLLQNQQSGFGTRYIPVKLPNLSGGHALALLDRHNTVVHFISWGGNITARNGPAAGRTAERLSKEESFRTLVGTSLQLIGRGNKYEDFKWDGPHRQTFGGVNRGQTFVTRTPSGPTPSGPTPSGPTPSGPTPSGPTPAGPTPSGPTPAGPVRPAPAGPSVPATAQHIQAIDYQTEKNRIAHHTEKLHGKEFFAVRRGQTFDIALVAPAQVGLATIKLTAYPETTTAFEVKVSNSNVGDPETEWFAYFTGFANGSTQVAVSIPGRAAVGAYTLSASGDEGKTWTEGEPVYILFNAWSPYDDVFLDNEAKRQEYVLGEDGYIWVGSYFNFSPRPWSFAQFNTKSLQASLTLLQKMSLADRADVVKVARNYSALVNSQDDQGVLVGNWSSNFSGGTPPTAWTGSADILKEYVLKSQPVRFGQCWVYSGVLTTVMRAVGIPARSVTNFASAHDVPDPVYNRSVDKYFKTDGTTEEESKNSDSVWNFHVWNDAWMARRDLGESNYTGWQAVDATPQERSGGKYQMGPVPISAVKDGVRGINYDMEFVYSEVNADEKFYVADGKGDYKLVRTVTDSVGKSMSTKAVGSSQREDVTLEYKYKESSPEERASHGADQTGPITFDLQVDKSTKLGQTIRAQLLINPQKASGTVKVDFSASIVTYTGKPVTTLLKNTQTVSVSQGTPTSVPFELTAQIYVPNLKGTNGILFRAYVTVPETKQNTIVQEEFDFVADDVAVAIEPKSFKQGSDPVATVRFDNPLPIALNNLVLSVEGTDLTKVQRFRFPSVAPGGTITQAVQLHAWASGKKVLIALLDSDEINDLRGHLEVIVG